MIERVDPMSTVEPDGNWPEDEGGATGGSVRHWGRLGGIGAALGMSAVFAAAAWYALQRNDMQPQAAAEVPLIKAEPGPVKEKPEDPGGLKIPNQDKLVYERITPKPQAPQKEKLAPAPEEPIVKTAEAAKPVAPAAPVIATPKTAPDAAKEPVKSEAAAPAAPKEAEKPAAKAEKAPAPATGEVHAAPPAITRNQEKTESLLPAAETKPKAATPAAKPAAAKAPEKTAVVIKKPAATPPVKPAPENKATAEKPSAPKAAAKTVTGYRIQLASYRNAALAQKMWKKLQKAHAAILGDLAAGAERADLGKRGVYFRLQAGAFESEAKARAVCRQLRAKKQDCIIVPPKK